ncbi:hypothetical protein [Mesorhizobium sp. RIZ17]|uniref:hypothetical protein n=1 Tax=Mesorhizobium sp. RIZ17 TaxID=3132743 RepID=UPI003DA87AC3
MAEPAVGKPVNEVNAARYDSDCQEALAGSLDGLLAQAEAAGLGRNRAATALMYLAGKRLNART